MPTVAELAPGNFAVYEKIGLPMLLLFINPDTNNFNLLQTYRCVVHHLSLFHYASASLVVHEVAHLLTPTIYTFTRVLWCN